MQPVNKLKDCPFCGGDKFTAHTDSGDERIGYNITHTITCSGCGCQKSARSKQDKNGWCVEGSDDVRKHAVSTWNTRATSIVEAELECARGDLKAAMEIVERNQKDADRYRIVRGHGVLLKGKPQDTVFIFNESADEYVDSLIAKERT